MDALDAKWCGDVGTLEQELTRLQAKKRARLNNLDDDSLMAAIKKRLRELEEIEK